MPTIEVNTAGDSAWPDLPSDVIHLPETVWKLAALEGGMSSGRVSLALRLDIDLPDESPFVVVAETSLAAWIAATCALRGRFPEEFVGTPLEDR